MMFQARVGGCIAKMQMARFDDRLDQPPGLQRLLVQIVIRQPLLGHRHKKVRFGLGHKQTGRLGIHGIDGALNDQIQKFFTGKGGSEGLADLAKCSEIILFFCHRHSPHCPDRRACLRGRWDDLVF